MKRIFNNLKAISKALLKMLIIGGIFFVGLTCATSSYAIVKGTDMNPKLVSNIGMVLMLASAVVWTFWGRMARTKVDERWRIQERERARAR